jgi:hypothetical protein
VAVAEEGDESTEFGVDLRVGEFGEPGAEVC